MKKKAIKMMIIEKRKENKTKQNEVSFVFFLSFSFFLKRSRKDTYTIYNQVNGLKKTSNFSSFLYQPRFANSYSLPNCFLVCFEEDGLKSSELMKFILDPFFEEGLDLL